MLLDAYFVSKICVRISINVFHTYTDAFFSFTLPLYHSFLQPEEMQNVLFDRQISISFFVCLDKDYIALGVWILGTNFTSGNVLSR